MFKEKYNRKRMLRGGQFFIELEKSRSNLQNLNKASVEYIPYSQERDGIGKFAFSMRS